MDNKFKHLEFIQNNISRMNQCSFQIKGWMITVVTALLALYAASVNIENGTGNNVFLIVAIIPVLVFWMLDSYYLAQERKFRALYDDVAGDAEIKNFSMNLSKYSGCSFCCFHIMFSRTEFLLYFSVLVALVAGFLFL